MYSNKDYYPFHMPGHKRRQEEMVNPFSIDITEIEGFDDLHHPEGILKEAQDEAAVIYGSTQSFYLINGSTAGILSALSASVCAGGHLLMARNCHKSAYHAAFLQNMQVTYLYPQWIDEFGCYGGIHAEQVENALQNDARIQAVCMVSPTYEGIVSDIYAIAEVCHRYQVPLIVDEAHGAHFPFGSEYPKSALCQGADAVIQSLHKTLPSLTQTAILHVVGERISMRRLQKYLDIYQTSSPSYVLMSSIQNCIRKMNTDTSREQMRQFAMHLHILHEQIRQLHCLQTLDIASFDIVDREKYQIYDIDISKIVIHLPQCCTINGPQLYQILLETYHLQAEMCTQNYVILMTSVNDSPEGFERLLTALQEIDQQLMMQQLKEQNKNSKDFKAVDKEVEWKCSGKTKTVAYAASAFHAQIAMTAASAFDCEQEEIYLEDCLNRISAEYLYIYPPGIPIVVPGEVITNQVLDICANYKRNGLKIHGLTDSDSVYVVKGMRMEK